HNAYVAPFMLNDHPSLHDALPSSALGVNLPTTRGTVAHRRGGSTLGYSRGDDAASSGASPLLAVAAAPSAALPMLAEAAAGMAEIGKHTSELQSSENLVCRLLLEK